LMDDEAHQMEMAVILSPTCDLEDLRFEDGIGVIPHALRRQVERLSHRLHLLIQGPQDAEVFDIGFDFGGLGGLREPLE